MGPSAHGSEGQRGSGQHGEGGGGGADLRGARPGEVAGKPLPPVQESHGATVGGHRQVDQRPRQARATLHPTRRPRLPGER